MFDVFDIMLYTYFFMQRDQLTALADKIVFTGMIDEFYNYCYGELEYRSLRFDTEVLACENYQGNAVVNFTEYDIPYTRIIEHKHFEFGCEGDTVNPKTVITKEYPVVWKHGDEPYYPMNDDRNNELFAKYRALADKEDKVIFGGRLGMYKYFDMHNVVAEALSCVEKQLL